MAVVTQTMQDNITELYLGFFGRAPDAAGFGYWTNRLAQGDVTIQQISKAFAKTPEFVSNYDGLTPTQQVTRVYQNVLNRAPDAGGLAYWVGQLTTGAQTIDSVVWNVTNSAFIQTGTADGQLVQNKVSVGEYFAVTLASNDTSVAATAYNLVTSNPASVAVADASLAQQVAPTYTMTTAIETIPASGAMPQYAKVNGVINGANGTYQTGDTINGTANGNNNVNVTIAAASGEANGPLVALNNIQTATFTTLAAAPINAQLFSNVGTVASSGSNNVLTVNNGAIASNYALSNTVGGTIDGLAIGIRAGDVVGTATTANFSVTNVGTAAVGTTAAVNSQLSTTVTGIENIAIATTGVNNFTFTGNTAAATDSASLTITGAGNNVITIANGGMATTNSISAATATGSLSLDVGTNLSTGDTYVGATGTTDVLRATMSGVVATGLNVSGFENFRMDSGAAATVAFATNPAFATVREDAVAAAGAAGGVHQLLNAGGFTALNLVGNSTAASTTAANNFSGVTATGGYTGTADTLTVTLSNGGQTLAAGGAYTVAQAITTSGVESYVINVNDLTANTNVTTFNDISDATTTSLTATSSGNIVFGAVGNVGGAAGNGNLTTINLAGVTGTNAVSTMTVANNSLAAAALVTAGASGLNLTLNAEQATDIVTFTGSTGADTITANVAGAPTLYVGNIVANGGAGLDTFLIGNGGAGAAGTTLTGGTGLDAFTLNNLLGNTITDLGTGTSAGNRETLTVGQAGTGLTATVTSNLVDTNTAGTDTFIYSNAGTAANVVLNMASGVTTVNLTGDVGAGGTTVNANATTASTITGSGGADVINGSTLNDTLVGGAGVDRIAGNGGTDTIDGGTGGDTLTGGAGVDTYGTASNFAAQGQGVALTAWAATNAGSVAAATTVAFTAGVDSVTNFVSGVDKLDVVTAAAAPTSLIGRDIAAAGAAGTTYVLYGTWNAANNVFSGANAYSGVNNAALVLQGDGATTLTLTTGYVLLTGLNQALVAADFV